jgi:hypothetical protein
VVAQMLLLVALSFFPERLNKLLTANKHSYNYCFSPLQLLIHLEKKIFTLTRSKKYV